MSALKARWTRQRKTATRAMEVKTAMGMVQEMGLRGAMLAAVELAPEMGQAEWPHPRAGGAAYAAAARQTPWVDGCAKT